MNDLRVALAAWERNGAANQQSLAAFGLRAVIDHESAAFDAETAELHDYLTLAVEYMDVKMQTEAIRPDGTVKRYSIDDTTWHRVLAIARGSLSDDARRVLTAPGQALLDRAAIVPYQDEKGEDVLREAIERLDAVFEMVETGGDIETEVTIVQNLLRALTWPLEWSDDEAQSRRSSVLGRGVASLGPEAEPAVPATGRGDSEATGESGDGADAVPALAVEATPEVALTPEATAPDDFGSGL